MSYALAKTKTEIQEGEDYFDVSAVAKHHSDDTH